MASAVESARADHLVLGGLGQRAHHDLIHDDGRVLVAGRWLTHRV